MNYIKQLQLIIILLCTIVVLSIVTGIAFFASYSPGSENVAQQSGSGSGQAGTPAAPQVAQITDPVAKAGEALFKNNCASCHAPSTEVVVGPGLAGITQRRPEAWLISWIKNSQKVIQSGDKYAVELFNKYNKTPMPAYENFSDDDIKSILKYVEAVNGNAGGSMAQN